MKIITNGDGMAKEVNPYKIETDTVGRPINIDKCHEWEKAHPPLPLIDQNGNEVKVKGEFEAAKIWQYRTQLDKWINYCRTEEFDIVQLYSDGIETREAYQIIAPNVPLINEPDITQPNEKESVEQAEKYLRTQIDNTLFSAYLVGAEKQDTFSSWNSNNKPTDAIISYFKEWQASQPNLISRDKVTGLIESRIKAYTDIKNGWGIPIQTISSKIEALTDLLTAIKQL